MGNVQSSTSNSQGPQRTLTLADVAPTVPHLDFQNMPFLKPPSPNETACRQGTRSQTIPESVQKPVQNPVQNPVQISGEATMQPQSSESSISLATSPQTPQMAALSPSSVNIEWNQGAERQPDIHHALNASPGVSLRAEIGVVSPASSETSLYTTFDSETSIGAAGKNVVNKDRSAASLDTSLDASADTTTDTTSSDVTLASSPSHSVSGSSISSQLSVLSQIYGPGGSPRTHRHAFRRHHSSDSSSNIVFQIDASVPPEVPPHLVFPADNSPPNSEKENMLAMIEALECEVEEEEYAARKDVKKSMHYEHYHSYGPHIQQQHQQLHLQQLQQQEHPHSQKEQELVISRQRSRSGSISSSASASPSVYGPGLGPGARLRSRSRSSSRSRSVSRSRSLSRSLSSTSTPQLSPGGGDSAVLRTDVYTRKCSSPEVPGLQPSESTDGRSSDTESDEPASPFSESSFALSGYNDGTTKLRVVNIDSPPQQAALVLPSPVSHEAVKPEKYRVKSKAQLAEEEEMLRKRYARYGHTYRGLRVQS